MEPLSTPKSKGLQNCLFRPLNTFYDAKMSPVLSCFVCNQTSNPPSFFLLLLLLLFFFFSSLSSFFSNPFQPLVIYCGKLRELKRTMSHQELLSDKHVEYIRVLDTVPFLGHHVHYPGGVFIPFSFFYPRSW